MAKKAHTKQHKVPRTYLEAFAMSDGRVWVADNKLRLYTQNPRNILTEDDFYTVRFPNGAKTLEVETKFLGGIEATYARLYREKLSQRKPLSDMEKAEMAIFIASMLERSPRRREAMKDGFDRIRELTEQMRSVVAGMSKDDRKVFESRQPIVTEEQRRNSMPADEVLKIAEDTASYHSESLPKMVTSTAPFIYEMNWAFLVRPVGSDPFVASDSPATIDNPSLPPNGFYGPGFAQKDVEITMALSPDLAVLAGWKLKKDRLYVEVLPQNVNEINSRIMRRSETLVSNDPEFLRRQMNRVRKALEGKQ